MIYGFILIQLHSKNGPNQQAEFNMAQTGTLTFLCGKMGAGKSTQSKLLADAENAVCISEDAWLEAHYPASIKSFDDYLKHAKLIKPFVKIHVQNILKTGTNVVMDFPANTIKQRSWFLSLCHEIGCKHQMLFLDISDARCLQQLAKRRIEQPGRAQFDTEAVFKQVTQFFEYPTEHEAVNIIHYT